VSSAGGAGGALSAVAVRQPTPNKPRSNDTASGRIMLVRSDNSVDL
jgi:hypothetical protein